MLELEYLKVPSPNEDLIYIVFMPDGFELHVTIEHDSEMTLKQTLERHLNQEVKLKLRGSR